MSLCRSFLDCKAVNSTSEESDVLVLHLLHGCPALTWHTQLLLRMLGFLNLVAQMAPRLRLGLSRHHVLLLLLMLNKEHLLLAGLVVPD